MTLKQWVVTLDENGDAESAVEVVSPPVRKRQIVILAKTSVKAMQQAEQLVSIAGEKTR